MSNYPEETGKAIDVPIWDRAHQQLNDIRNTLLKHREDLANRKDRCDVEMQRIDSALQRIQPPPPEPMCAPASMNTNRNVASLPTLNPW